MENNEFIREKKNNKSKTILLCIVGVSVVLLAVLGINYIMNLNNPRFLLKKLSNKIFDETLNVLDNVPSQLDDTYFYEGNIKFNTNIADYNFLNNEVIDYTFGLDINNKRVASNIKLTEESKQLFNIEGNISNNNIYIDLNDLFNKTIVIDENFIKDELKVSINDIFDEIKEIYDDIDISEYKYIVNRFKYLTDNVIDKVNYTKTKESLNINGKDINAKKIVINFDKENMDLIINTYIDGMLKDEELLKALSELCEIEEEDLRNNLKQIKDSDDIYIDNELELILYTKGNINEIIKVSIEQKNEWKIDFVNYDDYKLLVFDDFRIEINKQELIIKNDDEIIITGIVNSLEQENINIDFEITGTDTKGNIIYQNKDDNIKIQTVLENAQKKIDLEINSKNSSDKECIVDINMLIDVNKKNFNIATTTKVLKDREIKEYNPNYSINFKDITDEDFQTIVDNIQNNLKDTKIMDIINSNNNDIENDDVF